MSKDPAVLFYTSDFISGTLTMTDAQKGQYITLLCLQHQQGYLTEDDMLNICKTYDVRVFSKFEKNGDGKYYNERMKHESNKRKKYQESRKNNRIGNKSSDIEKPPSYVKHMENENKDVVIGGVGETKKLTIEEISVSFYKSEVDKAKSFPSKMTDEYITLARHICQTNEDGTFRMSLLLRVKKQLSLNEFSKLYQKSKRDMRLITDKIDSFQTNISYHKKYSDIYLCINKWLNPKQ